MLRAPTRTPAPTNATQVHVLRPAGPASRRRRLPAPPEGVLSVVTVSTSSSRSAAPPVAGLLQPPRDHPSAQRSRRLRED
eukprot:700830-Pyramimonas_sp.AAC.1